MNTRHRLWAVCQLYWTLRYAVTALSVRAIKVETREVTWNSNNAKTCARCTRYRVVLLCHMFIAWCYCRLHRTYLMSPDLPEDTTINMHCCSLVVLAGDHGHARGDIHVKGTALYIYIYMSEFSLHCERHVHLVPAWQLQDWSRLEVLDILVKDKMSVMAIRSGPPYGLQNEQTVHPSHSAFHLDLNVWHNS